MFWGSLFWQGHYLLWWGNQPRLLWVGGGEGGHGVWRALTRTPVKRYSAMLSTWLQWVKERAGSRMTDSNKLHLEGSERGGIAGTWAQIGREKTSFYFRCVSSEKSRRRKWRCQGVKCEIGPGYVRSFSEGQESGAHVVPEKESSKKNSSNAGEWRKRLSFACWTLLYSESLQGRGYIYSWEKSYKDLFWEALSF